MKKTSWSNPTIGLEEQKVIAKLFQFTVLENIERTTAWYFACPIDLTKNVASHRSSTRYFAAWVTHPIYLCVCTYQYIYVKHMDLHGCWPAEIFSGGDGFHGIAIIFFFYAIRYQVDIPGSFSSNLLQSLCKFTSF
ncbi:hypothetical protein BSKO_05453 [Bryopsis sp. KO-2023]|nr:hypothetical protein BSKO_05453 [Bryopsis sp. KO-2023]